MPHILRPRGSATARQDGERVLLFVNGQLVLDVPWEAADRVALALTIQARKAEELAKAERIIYDQAIATRLGLPFGLTSRPDMLKEACNEAAWNSDLRRYIRGDRARGMASQAVIGTPTIIRRDP